MHQEREKWYLHWFTNSTQNWTTLALLMNFSTRFLQRSNRANIRNPGPFQLQYTMIHFLRVRWSNGAEFEAEAKHFVWNVSKRVKKVLLEPDDSSFVVGESGVPSCFEVWVLRPFNKVLKQVEEKEFIEFVRSSPDNDCIGSPDFVFNINSTVSSFF
jgi:hypothetical protein